MKPLLFSALAFLTAPLASASVTIDYVTVGDAGNAADTTGYGAVAYTYNIARNETTVSQYAAFLNAAAKTDPTGLYDTSMAGDGMIADIVRSGVSGSYSYSVIAGNENKPITYVSWFDAARFVNWLSNGQGSGGTETGVYNLNGATSGIFMAQPGSSVWLPTEDEWYKAAYYDPTKNGGAGGYWTYATQSDGLAGNAIGVADSANIIASGHYARDRNGLSSYMTNVGAYGANSASHYGTNDQSGNVGEWNDAVISGSYRGVRGGSWNTSGDAARSLVRTPFEPSVDVFSVGFRVASVPEPGVWVLAVFSGALCVIRRKR